MIVLCLPNCSRHWQVFSCCSTLQFCFHPHAITRCAHLCTSISKPCQQHTPYDLFQCHSVEALGPALEFVLLLHIWALRLCCMLHPVAVAQQVSTPGIKASAAGGTWLGKGHYAAACLMPCCRCQQLHRQLLLQLLLLLLPVPTISCLHCGCHCSCSQVRGVLSALWIIIAPLQFCMLQECHTPIPHLC
jgi:hypothetical protein